MPTWTDQTTLNAELQADLPVKASLLRKLLDNIVAFATADPTAPSSSALYRRLEATDVVAENRVEHSVTKTDGAGGTATVFTFTSYVAGKMLFRAVMTTTGGNDYAHSVTLRKNGVDVHNEILANGDLIFNYLLEGIVAGDVLTFVRSNSGPIGARTVVYSALISNSYSRGNFT